MGHEMTKHDSAMFGSGRAAWHNLGKVIDGCPDAPTALIESGLDWQVGKEPLYLEIAPGQYVRVPNWYSTCRQDLPKDEPARVLGCVRQTYKVIQNVEAFNFATALLGQGVRFETAGSIRSGKVVYMLARKPENILVKDDTIGEYLLITNSHDGTRSMQVFFTSIRVVCSNTLHAAMRGARNTVKIPHKGDIDEQVKIAKGILGLADKYFTRFGALATSLADVKVTTDSANEFLNLIWPDGEKKTGITRATKRRDEVMGLFNGGQMGGSQDAVKGTAWGLLNALTEKVDHGKITGTRGRNPLEVSFERSMLTSGAKFKTEVTNRLVNFFGVGTGELMNLEVAGVN